MKQVVQNMKTGEIKVENLPAPAMKSGGILVKNHFSLISAGTEKSSVDLGKMSMLQKARSRPDDVRKVLQEIKQNGFLPTYKKVMSRLSSLKPLGYSTSGVVLAVDPNVSEFKAGDAVACAGAGYAVHADVVFVPKNLAVKLPPSVGLDEAAYATLGAIAMQGVRQTYPALGEKIVVIGLGLVGLLAVQILKANGCTVFGIDVDPENVELAKKLGADEACERSGNVNSMVLSFTEGYGADAVVIAAATRSSDPVALAGEIARDRSRIVMIGATGMNIPRPPYYLKELEFKLSRSYGPGRYDPNYEERGTDYPIGYVRWTENRNMKEFVHLLGEKKIDVGSLTTHRFSIDQAAQAYKLISGRRTEKYIGILLEYKEEMGEPKLKASTQEVRSDGFSGPRADAFKKNPMTVGFIGAGSFAQGNLIPGLKAIPGIVLNTVCTASGVSAKTAQNQFGFKYGTTDSKEVFSNDDIGTVFIATRHNLHAVLVVEAMKSGKNVFVEKPLALNEEELASIESLYKSSDRKDLPSLMVGFNRRFAPLTLELKKFFRQTGEPIVVNYRVNAGYIPRNHWTQDPVEGGGRINGEVCHFVDFIQYITSSQVEKVFAESISSDNSAITNNDNVNISLRMKNGSLGVITYLANGDSSLPKERVEVSSGRQSAVLDNFQYLHLYRNGSEKKVGSGRLDKGISNGVNMFMKSLSSDRRPLITFEEIVNTSLTTFRILTSLSLGEPVLL
ncbi:MAG: bi-domain-containing oxidoreductase [Bacteroidetes bacterium]|jgi:polar amino acid transport system substrate-binding protein|nr:bi-domain-containing oxidoreductase [Bacteroidota bacterium]